MVIDTTLVVPCFDEAARIDGLLAALGRWRDDRSPAADPAGAIEVVFVDDGSRDGTGARLAQAASGDPTYRVVSLPHNEGKGSALRAGVAAARGRRIVLLDADLAVGLEVLAPVLGALEAGADIAIGSRNAHGGRIAHPQRPWRRWLGRGYLALSRWWLDLEVTDVTCGFKGFRREIAKSLYATSRCRRWGIDAEVLSLARRRGHAVHEIPVVWSDGGATTVRLWRDVFGSFRELVAAGWRTRRMRPAPGRPADVPQEASSGASGA